jgi:GNAT superfamily N-acetyltransferase
MGANLELKPVGMEQEQFSVLSAYDVTHKVLLDYYHLMYPKRRKSLPCQWEWLNRTTFYEQRAPLIITHEGQVVAHLGMMPFEMRLGDEKVKAQWLIDFSIHPKYQRRGLGHLITQHWMEFSQVHLTCCNHRAIPIFKRLGWQQGTDSYLHFFFTRPFNYPKIKEKLPALFRRTFNRFSAPVFDAVYRKYSGEINRLRVESLDIAAFIDSSSRLPHAATTHRDRDYLDWRLLQSPDAHTYRCVRLEGNPIQFVVKCFEQEYNRHLEILMQTEPAITEDLIQLIATLARWAKINRFDYLLYYTTRAERSVALKRFLFSYTKYQIYAFHSHDERLFSKLRQAEFYWDFIDSDFEIYMDKDI